MIYSAARWTWRMAAKSAVISLAWLVLFCLAPARATMTETIGGPGGAPYSLVCPNSTFLVGFYAKAGGWVDSLGLLCAAYTPATGKMQNSTRGPSTGGPGGSPQEVYCVPGEAMTGIGVAFTRGGGLERQYTNTVDVFCPTPSPSRCISSGEGCGQPASHGSGPDVTHVVSYPYDKLMCPPNERATGIQGKSGNYVDSLGLICGPLPLLNTGRPVLADSPPKPPVAAPGPAPTPKPVHVTGQPTDQRMMPGIDMPGADYTSVEINSQAPGECELICRHDSKCLAWSYVKPGVQKPKAVCWLKSAVPPTRPDPNVTSGVKLTAQEPIH